MYYCDGKSLRAAVTQTHTVQISLLTPANRQFILDQTPNTNTISRARSISLFKVEVEKRTNFLTTLVLSYSLIYSALKWRSGPMKNVVHYYHHMRDNTTTLCIFSHCLLGINIDNHTCTRYWQSTHYSWLSIYIYPYIFVTSS